MTKPTRVAIAGANGRMGRELLHACLVDNNVELTAALVRAESSYIDKQAAQLASLEMESVRCTSQDEPFNDKADVLIDLTLPINTIANLQRCIRANLALVIGTTGFTTEQQSLINEAANHIPVLQASNMSIGVNLTLALLRQATEVLGDSAAIEITETHHIHKLDSPSGTAITMAEVMADTLGKNIDDCMVIHSIREGEVVGDHKVSFILGDEKIEITHKAGNRQIFAKGAIKAARWLVGKEPGMYSMDDVLGL